jgi:hemerythrin-like metal-binding protein
LFDSVAGKQDKETLTEVLDGLVRYTIIHFSAEEEAMLKHGYPDYGIHKQKHEELIAELDDICKKFKAGKTSITIDVLIFLVNWLKTHIAKTDKNYVSFFNEKGVT